MTDYLLFGILGALAVNQLFATFVQRGLGRAWPRLTITTEPWPSRGRKRVIGVGGRRATDKPVINSDYQTQKERLLRRAFDAAVSGSSIVAAEPRAKLAPVTFQVDQPTGSTGATTGGATWSGWRKVRVDHCRDESPDCRSFRFVPVDGVPFPRFRAGQSILVGVDHPASGKRLARCYSLSGGPGEASYRITVKRVPGGVMSNWLHDHVRVNDEIEIQAPRGSFHANDDLRQEPLVLIAAGIGITPMLSMFLENLEHSPSRPVEIFYQLRTPDNAPFLHLLRQSVGRLTATLPVRLHVFFSDASGDKLLPGDTPGRLSATTILDRCGAAVGDHLICGPAVFMSSIAEGLVAGGVTENRVRYESFGGKPNAIGAVRVPAVPPVAVPVENVLAAAPAGSFRIHFDASDHHADWTESAGSLLEVAEAAGLTVPSGCRSGDCGACILKLRLGSVTYATPPGCDFESDEVVACVARPASDLVVDA